MIGSQTGSTNMASEGVASVTVGPQVGWEFDPRTYGLDDDESAHAVINQVNKHNRLLHVWSRDSERTEAMLKDVVQDLVLLGGCGVLEFWD